MLRPSLCRRQILIRAAPASSKREGVVVAPPLLLEAGGEGWLFPPCHPHTGCFAPLVVLPLYSTPPQPHKYPPHTRSHKQSHPECLLFTGDTSKDNHSLTQQYSTHPPPPNLTPQYPHDILPNTISQRTPPLFVTVKNNGSGLLNHLEQADEYGA